MEEGKEVARIYTAVDITLTTDPTMQATAQYLPGGGTLHNITIHADTVTILGHINLFETSLRIVARQLLCSLPWAQTCVISTSARRHDTAATDNSQQAMAGGDAQSWYPISSGTNGAAGEAHPLLARTLNCDAAPPLRQSVPPAADAAAAAPAAGRNGADGLDAGNIEVVAWSAAPNIRFKAQGADGVPGQVGGDGGTGGFGEPHAKHATIKKDTVDAGEKYDNIQTACHFYSCEPNMWWDWFDKNYAIVWVKGLASRNGGNGSNAGGPPCTAGGPSCFSPWLCLQLSALLLRGLTHAACINMTPTPSARSPAGANGANGAGGWGGSINITLGAPGLPDVFGYNTSFVFSNEGGRGTEETRVGKGGKGGQWGGCAT